MSLLQSEALYTAVVAAVTTAWSVPVVFLGKPLLPSAYPYGVVALSTVPMEDAGSTTTEQTYEFLCVYVAAWNTSDPTWNVEVAKQDAANSLITQLMGNATFASLAYMPRIVNVDFNEIDDSKVPLYEVYVTFSCRMTVSTLIGG